jgi:autotransporter-associated beta strand protein
MKPTKNLFLRASSVLAGLVSSLSVATATSDSWSTTAASGTWASTSNWAGGNVPGDTTGTTNTDTATFTTSTTTAVTVDSNRNIQNITFGGGATFTLSGGPLLLTSGGKIYSNGSAVNENISSALQVQGDGGSYTIQTDTPGTNRVLALSGAISGVSTTGNTTAITFTGSSGAANAVSNVISDGSAGGKVSITKDGAGLWVFSGANTYSGGTTIKNGTLRLSNSGNTSGLIGAGKITFDGSNAWLRTQSTGAVTFNNDIEVTSNGGNISARANSTFNPNTLTGTGTLNLALDSGVTLTSSSFKGFTGTIKASANSGSVFLRLGSGFDETSLANATVRLETGTTLTRQYGTNNTITTNIGSLSGASGSSIGGSATGSGTFVLSIGAKNEASTFSGAITNGGGTVKTAITKTGSASLTLDGTSTYTGATSISQGTLVVNGVLGETAVSVTATSGTATLGGSGTIGSSAASLTVGSNGYLAPGNSPGTLTVNGSVSLNAGSTYNYQFTGGGTAADLVDANGTLNINGGTLSLENLGTAVAIGDKYTLFAYNTAGTLTGFDGLAEGAQFSAAGSDWVINYASTSAGLNGGTGTSYVTITSVVPEPGAALLGMLGVLGILRRRRI